MIDISRCIIITGDRVVGTRTAAGTGHGIVNANNGCFLGIIRFVSAANGKGGTAALGSFHSSTQCICQILGRGTITRRSRNTGNRIGDFIAGTKNQGAVGISCSVRRTDNAVRHSGIIRG